MDAISFSGDTTSKGCSMNAEKKNIATTTATTTIFLIQSVVIVDFSCLELIWIALDVKYDSKRRSKK